MSKRTEVEIIDFHCPSSNRKNLFVTGIPAHKSSEDTYIDLYNIFSNYGLIYEIQLFPCGVKAKTTGVKWKETPTEPGFYSFVKFYSSMSARKAKEGLSDKLKFGEYTAKMAYAKRTKEQEARVLTLDKCRELSNYYLGYNGWSSEVKLIKDVSESSCENGKRNVKYICITEITIPKHGLHTEGVGAWEEQFSITDPTTKGAALHKVKKFSYLRSLVDAFRKLVIIVLSSGKVSVEVNTTVPELLLKEAEYNAQELLKINEIDEEPQLSDMEDNPQSTLNMDDQNIQILQELEDG